jgi:hypothetical protein
MLFVLFLGSAVYGFAYNANQAMEEADTYLINALYSEHTFKDNPW